MTLLRLIPDKSSSTFSIVNASPNVNTTKDSNSNTIHHSNDHHPPSDASLLFRLAHDLHPANVSRHQHQTPRRASPPNHHRHLQQNHIQQNHRHQKPINKDHPPTNKPHLPPNPQVHSPFSRRRPTPPPPRLPRGTPLLPGKPKQPPPHTPHPTHHNPPQTPHTRNHHHHASQTPPPGAHTMPLMPTKVEAPPRSPEESLAVVDPQRPGQQQRGGVVDYDAEILHAYDVGVCAAIRSMAAYWAGRAGERHVSFSERRIFRREAERLRGLVEEAEGEVGRSWVDVRGGGSEDGGLEGGAGGGGCVSRPRRRDRGRRRDDRVGNERLSRAGRGNGEGGRGDGLGGLEARGGTY